MVEERKVGFVQGVVYAATMMKKYGKVGENNKYSILDGFCFLDVTYDNCRLYRLLSSDFSYEISKLDE